MEQMEQQTWARDAKTEILRRELQKVKTKNKSKSFVQTWEINETLEIHDPITRVQAMLEQSKKIDLTQRYVEQLNELVITERANWSTYAEISKSEASIGKGISNFVWSAPNYSGNP